MLSWANRHALVVAVPPPHRIVSREIRDRNLPVRRLGRQHYPQVAMRIKAEDSVAGIHPTVASCLRSE